MDALTVRVNEAEDRVSDTKDKLMERKEGEEKRKPTNGPWVEESKNQ